jgi:uncharacterized phage infection (PIP) family protein YhgE
MELTASFPVSKNLREVCAATNQIPDAAFETPDGTNGISNATNETWDEALETSNGAKEAPDGAFEISDATNEASDGTNQASDAANEASNGAFEMSVAANDVWKMTADMPETPKNTHFTAFQRLRCEIYVAREPNVPKPRRGLNFIWVVILQKCRAYGATGTTHYI